MSIASTVHTQDEKYIKMTETPVGKLVGSLAVPTILSMMVTSIYNMADTYFVGQLAENSATAGVGICMSFMTIIQAIGFTFGQGSGTIISRLLGAKDEKKASQVAVSGFVGSIFFGLLLTLTGFLFMEPMLRFMGATDTNLPYAKEYLFYILFAAPFTAASFTLNNQLRYQGSAMYSMVGITTGGILNIALDPIFIFTLDMGAAGASCATMISQMVSFSILLCMTFRGTNIPMRLKHFTIKLSIYKDIIRYGLPTLLRQGMASIATAVLNTAAGAAAAVGIADAGIAALESDAAIAAMSVVGKVSHLSLSVLLGFGQGFQPVSAYNFGAKKYRRVSDAFWFCVKLGFCVLLAVGISGAIFSEQIINIFRNDERVVEIGAFALRWYFIFFPLSAWTVLCNMLTQTIGQTTTASALSLSRQGLFLIPMLYILPSLIGLTGVQLAQPISDVCSFSLAVILTTRTLKWLKQLQREQDELEANANN